MEWEMYKFRESGTFAVNVQDIPPSSSSPASAHASGVGVRSSACDRTTQGEGGWRDMADNITTATGAWNVNSAGRLSVGGPEKQNKRTETCTAPCKPLAP